MWLLLSLHSAFATECTQPISSDTLDTQLDSVAMGFLEFKIDKITKGLQSIEDSIPCLSEAIDPSVAHDYHMLNGLFLYASSQTEQAEYSLRLAKRLAPEKTIPTHLFPDGHEIHTMYAELEYIELDSNMPSSPRGVYIFNGQTVNRPVGTRSIVQIKEGSTILLSTIIGPEDALPVPSTKTATATIPPVITEDSPTRTVEPVLSQMESTAQIPVSQPETFEGKDQSPSFFWLGSSVLSAAGAAGTFYAFCGSLDRDCEAPNEGSVEKESLLKYGNYALLGATVFSTYKFIRSMGREEESAQARLTPAE